MPCEEEQGEVEIATDDVVVAEQEVFFYEDLVSALEEALAEAGNYIVGDVTVSEDGSSATIEFDIGGYLELMAELEVAQSELDGAWSELDEASERLDEAQGKLDSCLECYHGAEML